MRLDIDCVRNVLYTVENHTDGINFFELNETNYKNYHLLTEYNFIIVRYHVKQLINGGFISEAGAVGNQILIIDLTWNGHQFIENIRNDNNWNKIKNIAKKAGSFSISLLAEIAAQVVAQVALAATLPNQ